MFKLTYRDPHDRDHSRVEYFDDIKDLGQALINIVDNEKEEQSAMDWCGRAHWGAKVVRQQFGYKIECFNEEELKNNIEETVVKPICKHFNIRYSFIGWDNDAMTWDLDTDLSLIKFHDNYGYYFVMNKDNYPNGNIEIFSTTNKDKNKFITDVIVGLEKVIRNQMKKTSRVQSRGSALCMVDKNTLMAKEVVNNIKNAEADGKEWHGRIYEDNCWWADVERHPYGQIRFWVGFEDKRSGKSRASLVTLAYLNNNGDLRYYTDGILIKQAVWNKIQSIAKALIKEKLLII